MESKHSAEEILKEQGIEFCSRDYTSGLIRKADILSVLREVASIAWDAGYKRMGWEEGMTWSKTSKIIEEPDRETFLKQLLKGE